MQWRRILFGNVDRPEERDPLGRIPPDPLFDAFRGARKIINRTCNPAPPPRRFRLASHPPPAYGRRHETG